SSTTLPGDYSLAIYAAGADPQLEVQPAFFGIIVTGSDFAVSVDPLSLTFTPGLAGTQKATINLASVDGFTGYVNTTITLSPATPDNRLHPNIPDTRRRRNQHDHNDCDSDKPYGTWKIPHHRKCINHSPGRLWLGRRGHSDDDHCRGSRNRARLHYHSTAALEWLSQLRLVNSDDRNRNER